jgi:hypothetical protein
MKVVARTRNLWWACPRTVAVAKAVALDYATDNFVPVLDLVQVHQGAAMLLHNWAYSPAVTPLRGGEKLRCNFFPVKRLIALFFS